MDVEKKKRGCTGSCSKWAITLAVLFILFFIIKIPGFLAARDRARFAACVERVNKFADTWKSRDKTKVAFDLYNNTASLCLLFDNIESGFCEARKREGVFPICPVEKMKFNILDENRFELKWEYHGSRGRLKVDCDICYTESGYHPDFEYGVYDECREKQDIECYHEPITKSDDIHTEQQLADKHAEAALEHLSTGDNAAALESALKALNSIYCHKDAMYVVREVDGQKIESSTHFSIMMNCQLDEEYCFLSTFDVVADDAEEAERYIKTVVEAYGADVLNVEETEIVELVEDTYKGVYHSSGMTLYDCDSTE